MTTALSDTVAAELHGRLSDVCAQIGVDPHGARLVKYTMNAVFVAPPIVIRLAAGPHAATLARRVVSVAACLEQVGMPTVRLATGVTAQPIFSGDWVATAWQYVPTTGDEPKPVDLAAPLRVLHSLDGLDVALPRWSPIEKFRRRLNAAAALPNEEAAELERWSSSELGISVADLLRDLHRRCDEVEEDLDRVAWRLPPGSSTGTRTRETSSCRHQTTVRSPTRSLCSATWTGCASDRVSGISCRPPTALPGSGAQPPNIGASSLPTGSTSPPGRVGRSCAAFGSCSWLPVPSTPLLAVPTWPASWLTESDRSSPTISQPRGAAIGSSGPRQEPGVASRGQESGGAGSGSPVLRTRGHPQLD